MAGRTVIVGAGVAGLTLAERLLSLGSGEEVVVVEREENPGGLARTFRVEGFCFDIGPHRFHTADAQVDRYLKSILGNRYVVIPRKSSVFMEGRYRSWPLSVGSLAGLPAGMLLGSLGDMLRRKGDGPVESFADFIRARYGGHLYDYFFRGYTRKFSGMDPEEMHPDWAEAGVNRAVIDKRVKADTLFSMFLGMLAPKPVHTSFYYPSEGGIQSFCDMQSSMVQRAGGALMTGIPAEGIVTDGGRVRGITMGGGGVLEADRVFWSAPVSLLYPEAGFTFIHTLAANIGLRRRNPGNDYQWCYFGQEELCFSRTTVPRNFRGDTVPPGADSICAEITVTDAALAGGGIGEIQESLLPQLERVGALRMGDVEFVDWRLVRETYPVYDRTYRERLASVAPPENLTLLGRCGSFWYNNMDHSISQALAFSRGERHERDFWSR